MRVKVILAVSLGAAASSVTAQDVGPPNADDKWESSRSTKGHSATIIPSWATRPSWATIPGEADSTFTPWHGESSTSDSWGEPEPTEWPEWSSTSNAWSWSWGEPEPTEWPGGSTTSDTWSWGEPEPTEWPGWSTFSDTWSWSWGEPETTNPWPEWSSTSHIWGEPEPTDWSGWSSTTDSWTWSEPTPTSPPYWSSFSNGGGISWEFSTTTHHPSTSSTVPLPSETPSPPPKPIDVTEGTCKWGYTYCGWMLTGYNGFSNETITDAFTAAFKAWGSLSERISAEDYAQRGLYVCLPPEADPKSMWKAREKLPRKQLGRWWDPWSTEAGTATHELGPIETDSDPDYDPDDGTRPHKLELLCACSGSTPEKACLNPLTDQIGRCSKPCFN